MSEYTLWSVGISGMEWVCIRMTCLRKEQLVPFANDVSLTPRLFTPPSQWSPDIHLEMAKCLHLELSKLGPDVTVTYFVLLVSTGLHWSTSPWPTSSVFSSHVNRTFDAFPLNTSQVASDCEAFVCPFVTSAGYNRRC